MAPHREKLERKGKGKERGDRERGGEGKGNRERERNLLCSRINPSKNKKQSTTVMYNIQK